MKTVRNLLLIALICAWSCSDQTKKTEVSGTNEFLIDYEKYELENGLDVILHKDTSDPIVAVAVVIHAGSNREKPGKTGFAHFFEHMLFKKSENVPEGYFMNKIPEWGGTLNGFTNKNQTVYYEVVPNNALEKILWMESDRMGFLINAVDNKSFETEKQVVKNEKRFRYDNVAYGHTEYAIIKELYPENHPYNWTTIGELEDLQNAQLNDVKEFYDQWYGPGNATLVIAGDYDTEQTKKWIERYFGEIKPHGEQALTKPMPVSLESMVVQHHEDQFAKLPELTLTFPTVEDYHDDYWALNVLGDLLSEGRTSHLYKQVVLTDKLAPEVSAYNYSQEIAGRFEIVITANEQTDLDEVQESVFRGLENFETEGFKEEDLNRVKANLETSFYNGISSVLGKAFQLGNYNTFTGDPGFIKTDIRRIQEVKKEDVLRVYEKYLNNKNYIATAFIPKGQLELALENSVPTYVKEETVTPYVPEIIGNDTIATAKTPTSFDRSIEPDFSAEPSIKSPDIWTSELSNKLKVYGINSNELPMVSFSIRLKGGMLLDKPEKVGVANLTAEMLMKGTKNLAPEALENAIRDLGASVNITTSNEYITLTVNCLSKNYHATLALVNKIITEPRWDEAEFERVLKEVESSIKQRDVNPNAIAAMARNKVLFGQHMLSNHPLGTQSSLSTISLDDLKKFYDAYFSPNLASFHVAGNISKTDALSSIKDLADGWENKNSTLPNQPLKSGNIANKIYFVDVPGSKQSQLHIARMTVPGTNSKDYLSTSVANYQLGAGSHGYLYQNLRTKHGYTYGAYSFPIRRVNSPSQLLAFSAVRTNVTKESIEEFITTFKAYRQNYDKNDLEKTKNSLLREAARDYETLNDLLGILQTISTYNLPLDFIKTEQDMVKAITLDETRALIDDYIDPSEMIYVVVGDKATQFERLKELGMGTPVLLSKYGEPFEEVKE